jgi:hypothetical protein
MKDFKRLKTIIIKNLLLVILIFVSLISCDEKKDTEKDVQKLISPTKYKVSRKDTEKDVQKLISPTKYKVLIKENNNLCEISFQNLGVSFSLVYFKESGNTFALTNKNESYYIYLDWILNEELKLSMENIYLYKIDENVIVILPIFSEEFDTFQMIKIRKDGKINNLGLHTFSYNDAVKINYKFLDIKYFLIQKDNSIRIYSKTDSTGVMLSDLNFNVDIFEKITSQEKEEIKNLRQTTIINSSIKENH